MEHEHTGKTFPLTDRTTISRLPKRGRYDRNIVYAILDEALFCTVAYASGNLPHQIPTGFCRVDDTLYFHGSVGSHFLREIMDKGLDVCINVTLMDALVLARSAFHHSMNYRSVVMFGKPILVTDAGLLDRVMEAFTNKLVSGRWDLVRKPTVGEWKATMVLGLPIVEASAKIREGFPVDDEEDLDMDVWAGLVPLKSSRQTPQPDPKLKEGKSYQGKPV